MTPLRRSWLIPTDAAFRECIDAAVERAGPLDESERAYIRRRYGAFPLMQHADGSPKGYREAQFIEMKRHRAGAPRKPIIATLPDGSEEYYDGGLHASRCLNCDKANISKAVHGLIKTVRGRTWRLAAA